MAHIVHGEPSHNNREHPWSGERHPGARWDSVRIAKERDSRQRPALHNARLPVQPAIAGRAREKGARLAWRSSDKDVPTEWACSLRRESRVVEVRA